MKKSFAILAAAVMLLGASTGIRLSAVEVAGDGDIDIHVGTLQVAGDGDIDVHASAFQFAGHGEIETPG